MYCFSSLPNSLLLGGEVLLDLGQDIWVFDDDGCLFLREVGRTLIAPDLASELAFIHFIGHRAHIQTRLTMDKGGCHVGHFLIVVEQQVQT